MKHLVGRFSLTRDSSEYKLLRSDSHTRRSQTLQSRRRGSFRAAILAAASRSSRRAAAVVSRFKKSNVPDGHFPVFVGDGDEMERFFVSAEFLNHPVFVSLLEKSAQEYGFNQEGVLRIPCQVFVFERVMESVRLGLNSFDLQGLVNPVDN